MTVQQRIGMRLGSSLGQSAFYDSPFRRASPSVRWATAGSIGLALALLGEGAYTLLISHLGLVQHPGFALALAVLGAAALSLSVARPEIGLGLTLVYVLSPLSFYLVFRHASWSQPYPDATDLAIDGLVTATGSAATFTGLLLRGSATIRSRAPFELPLVALAAVALVAGAYGLVRGNGPRLVASDLLPIGELVFFYFATLSFIREPQVLKRIFTLGIATMALTAIVRLGLYTQGQAGIGVAPIVLAHRTIPRLFLLQPVAWVLPLVVAYAFHNERGLRRLLTGSICGLFTVEVLLSFERGLWAFALVGLLVVGLNELALIPSRAIVLKSAVALAVGGLVVAVSLQMLTRSNPLGLIIERVAYTGQQLQGASPIQHKRQDETADLIHSILNDRWQLALGHGLGATYLGPTGLREGDYLQTQLTVKHYTFNTYLGVAYRMGLVGLAVLLWFVGAALASAWKLMRRADSSSKRAMAAAVFGATLGLAVMSIVDPYLLAHPMTVLEGVTLGALALATYHGRAPRVDDPQSIGTAPAAGWSVARP